MRCSEPDFPGLHENHIPTVSNGSIASGAEVVAADIPSGINGTTGIAEGPAVHAHGTATFGSLKTGLLCNQGREYSGRVSVVDIGIPKQVISDPRHTIRLVKIEDVRNVLPKRSLQANKYTTGKIFILAGSRGLTGAAALTSLAALRTGAGAVLLGTPDSVYPILARKLTETMVLPLPSTPEGGLGLKSFEIIREKINWAGCCRHRTRTRPAEGNAGSYSQNSDGVTR